MAKRRAITESGDEPGQHWDHLLQVRAAKERIRQAEADLKAAETERAKVIKAALEAGVPRTDISDEADLSLSRLYQIRDGRR